MYAIRSYYAKSHNKNEDLEKNLELFKIASAFSQEEGLVIFDSSEKPYFYNTKAKEHKLDANILLEALKNESDRVILNDCEASILTKEYEGFTIVSLKQTSIHDNKDVV